MNVYNRAEIVDQNFSKSILAEQLPQDFDRAPLKTSGLTSERFLDLFESQMMSRHLDLRARELKNQNLCFYTIGSSGHEGNAAAAEALLLGDPCFLHYRSGGFMMQRSKKLPGSTPLYDSLLSFVAAKSDPIAGGRHKVWGSLELNVPPQTSTIASHLPKAVGAALSIAKARDLKLKMNYPLDSVVFCNFGDASANHATALSAINTASLLSFQNLNAPIVFFCEDNGIGISVPTPQNWIRSNFSNRPGLRYFECNGLSLTDTFATAQRAIRYSRSSRKPSFVRMNCVRLMGHAGSDMELNYLAAKEVEHREFNDPLLHSAEFAIDQGLLSKEDLLGWYEQIRTRVRSISDEVIHLPKIESPKEIASSVTACRNKRISPEIPSREKLSAKLGREAAKLLQPLHLAKLLNFALAEALLRYPQSLIFGEDVAKKGGVYNVTNGLFKMFGPRRVFNSPLDETSILGSAIGYSQNGFLPIPEIQFLAYVHNAEDQIRGEAATLPFFSQGQFTNPMVIRIAGLAYQKGFGGHFHNDNSLAIFRDIPGLIIAVPSNGADAVKMFRRCLRLAFEEGRVIIFIEPIALYMTKDLHQEGDLLWTNTFPPEEEELEPGEFGTSGEGQDLLIISYGNGFYYSQQAAQTLSSDHQIESQVVDLRWIAPIDTEKLSAHVSNFKKVLIVDECRKTGSLSEFLVSALVENLDVVPQIKVVAAEDCFIPLGVAAAAGLPKKAEIVQSALTFFNRD